MKNITLVCFLLLFFDFTLIGQNIPENITAEDYIAYYMYKFAVPNPLLSSPDNRILYELLLEELDDCNEEKKRKSIVRSINRIAIYSKDTLFKNEVVFNLLTLSLDENYHSVRNFILDNLTTHSKECFSNEKNKVLIKQLLENNKANSSLLLLAGFTGDEDFIPYLKRYLNYNKSSFAYYGSREWKANLALARLGVKECILFVTDKVRQHNEVTIALYFLDDLNYVQQKETLAIMLTILNSDLIIDTGHEKQPINILALKRLKRSILNLHDEDGNANSKVLTKDDLNKAREITKNIDELEFLMDNFD